MWKINTYYLDFLEAERSGLQQTITQMADQGRSDLDAVFTMILCATNFFIWKAMELIFTN